VKSYRIKLRLESSLITPIMGDTLFGHICWGIHYNKGERILEDFLNLYKEEKPPLIISDGFPTGMLPKPILDIGFSDKEIDLKKIQSKKRLKKIKYIPFELFSNGNVISEQNLINWIEKEDKIRMTVIEERMHNSINRLSNTVNDIYSTDELFFENNAFFDVYVVSQYESSKVEELFNQGLENGYGADKFTGKGNLKVEHIETVSLNMNGNRSMALGAFVPEKRNDLFDLKADIFTKFGKLGGHYVTSFSPFKKPILMFAAGATFNVINNSFIGVLLNNIHKLKKISQHAMTPVINFNEEVL